MHTYLPLKMSSLNIYTPESPLHVATLNIYTRITDVCES